MAVKITVVVKRFPNEFPISSMMSCEDPDNPSHWPDHNKELERSGWCPACGEAVGFHIQGGDYWQLGVTKDGELVVAYQGPSGATIHVFNYERFRKRS